MENQRESRKHQQEQENERRGREEHQAPGNPERQQAQGNQEEQRREDSDGNKIWIGSVNNNAGMNKIVISSFLNNKKEAV